MPEDLLEVIKVPVVIGWGVEDPWEPIEQGRAYADYDSVEVRSCHGVEVFIYAGPLVKVQGIVCWATGKHLLHYSSNSLCG